LNKLFTENRIDYTGEQLRSNWALEMFGTEPDSIVSFTGECDVKPEFMVDLVDLREGSRIYSPLMLHFIVEHAGADLEKGVLRQRLLAAIAGDYIRRETGRTITRDGDDLYLQERKISISIATVSPASTLIHFGINILTKGVPVPACGLEELGLEADVTAHRIMDAYAAELASAEKARTSARPVD
jgi:hypothetical protein